ncbi:MAG: hypothetical protein AAF711_11715 [Planctomycetota bacterium]
MQPVSIDFDIKALKSNNWFWAQLMGAVPADGPTRGQARWIYTWVEVFPLCLGDQEGSWFIRDAESARQGTAEKHAAYNTLELSNPGEGVMGSGDWVPVRPKQGSNEEGNCAGVEVALQPLGPGAVVRMTQYVSGDTEMFFFSAPNNISERCMPYPFLILEEISSTEPSENGASQNGNSNVI